MKQPERNHYQILGVTVDAPEKEIKRSYHRLARKMHPDRVASTEESSKSGEEFALVSTAYNVLKDKDKRKEYDASLEKGKAGQASAPSAGGPNGNGKAKGDRSAMSRMSETGESARAAIAKKAFSRGMRLYNLGEFSKAIEYFEAAIQNKKDEGVYFARTAKAMMNARRSFNKARELALKAIELDPYNVEFRMSLAEICEMAGSNSLALQAYKEVLRWDPENQKAMTCIAELERGQNQSFLKRIIGKIRKK